jgi:transposase-like protein
MLNDRKAGRVESILIACIDGFAVFPEVIAAPFLRTEVHFCIVHQITN